MPTNTETDLRSPAPLYNLSTFNVQSIKITVVEAILCAKLDAHSSYTSNQVHIVDRNNSLHDYTTKTLI